MKLSTIVSLAACSVFLAVSGCGKDSSSQTAHLAEASVPVKESTSDKIWVGIAVVKDGMSPQTCARTIKALGAEIDQVLDFTGIISFRIPLPLVNAVRVLDCVADIELDSIMSGKDGVAGATNSFRGGSAEQ